MLVRALRLFLGPGGAEAVVVVVPPGDREEAACLVEEHCPPGELIFIEGGATRLLSVARGLEALPPGPNLVAVHDGARPLATPALLRRVINAALEHGAALPALVPPDTVKVVDERGFVVNTPSREDLRLVQTPQVFRRDLLLKAYSEALRQGREATDDAALVEALGKPVFTVPGERTNIKLTRPGDLALAGLYLERGEDS